MAAAVPPGLPRLQVGAHLGPEDGACVMEYVSVLTGARFSDHPRCTDPTVAALARLVNDSCSDAGRPQLAPLAPLLASTPRRDAAFTAAVVRAVVETSCAAVGATPTLRRHLRGAQRRLQVVTGTGRRAAWARRLDWLYGRGPARRGLEASVRALAGLTEEQRDAVLVAMLTAAVGVDRVADRRRYGTTVASCLGGAADGGSSTGAACAGIIGPSPAGSSTSSSNHS
jgi:hypothetical protein